MEGKVLGCRTVPECEAYLAARTFGRPVLQPTIDSTSWESRQPLLCPCISNRCPIFQVTRRTVGPVLGGIEPYGAELSMVFDRVKISVVSGFRLLSPLTVFQRPSGSRDKVYAGGCSDPVAQNIGVIFESGVQGSLMLIGMTDFVSNDGQIAGCGFSVANVCCSGRRVVTRNLPRFQPSEAQPAWYRQRLQHRRNFSRPWRTITRRRSGRGR